MQLRSHTRTRVQAALANRSAERDVLERLETAAQYVDKLLTAAQVLALNATPVTIIPAPGAGKYLEFLGALVFMDFNSTAYTGGAGRDLALKYTNGSGAQVSFAIDDTVFAGKTADILAAARPAAVAADALIVVENAPIVAHMLVGEWTVGNSPLKIRAFYREVEKSLLEGIG